jgi:hypothetical protein
MIWHSFQKHKCCKPRLGQKDQILAGLMGVRRFFARPDAAAGAHTERQTGKSFMAALSQRRRSSALQCELAPRKGGLIHSVGSGRSRAAGLSLAPTVGNLGTRLRGGY